MGQLSHHHQLAIRRHEAVVVTGERFCDFCIHPSNGGGGRVVAVVDGKTIFGPWGNMCDEHFEVYGLGLGLGKGQRLLYQEYEPGPMSQQEKKWQIQKALSENDFDAIEGIVGDGDIVDLLP